MIHIVWVVKPSWIGSQGLVACVSDSFDVFKACREYWGDALKDKIKGRISLGLRFPFDNPEDGYEWLRLGLVLEYIFSTCPSQKGQRTQHGLHQDEWPDDLQFEGS